MKISKYHFIRHKQAIIGIHVITSFIFVLTSVKA